MQSSSEHKGKTIVGLIIILALLIFLAILGSRKWMIPVVTIKVDNIEIREGESVPEPRVQIEFSGKDKDVILDEETKYTIKHLLDDLSQGKGYSINHKADSIKEGEYPLDVVIEEELKHKFIVFWKNKIKYQVESGSLKVLNKYGDWEEGKFRMLDGTYASGWTNLGADTYYFGEDGKRVTGQQTILGNTYYFLEDGKFDTEKNKVNPNRPMIALTFDDGPSKFTMQLLEVLEKHNAKATFFMVGSNVGRYPDVVRRMEELGCELGNHTMNHARLTTLEDAGVLSEIEGTNEAVSKILGKQTDLLRPPYGAVDDRVKALANVPVVLWSVDTRDWELNDAGKVSNHVLETVKDGDIVLMHDIYDTTIQAATEFIPQLIEKGYQLVTVSEMAQARGITLENGKIYSRFYKQ